MLINKQFYSDIYFKEEYCNLYLKEGDELLIFLFEEGDSFLKNIMIKRSIDRVGNVMIEEEIYDAETAYGYGGPQTNITDINILNKAKEAYFEFCKEQNIIAEFFRMHPFVNYEKFRDHFYDFSSLSGNVVYIDTNLTKEERWASYPAKTRNILRRCYEKLEVRKTDNIDAFLKMYSATMKKNDATDFYFFQRPYFEKILSIDNIDLYEVVLDNQVISMGIFMHSDEIMHYHLSANDYTYSKYNGNYILLDYIADISREKGCKYFMLGGGRTGNEDDNLLKFKKKFSNKTLPFYIGGIVHDQEKFDFLNETWNQQYPDKEAKYFQKYRL